MEPTDTCPGDAAPYVLRALSPREAAIFEAHLRTCSVCQDEVESLQGLTDSLAMSAPRRRAPRRLRRRVMAAVREDAKARAAVQRRWPARRTIWAGAAAIVAVVVALVVVQVSASGGNSSTEIHAFLGNAQVRMNGDNAELVVHHLKYLDADHAYEVWLKDGTAAPQPTNALFDVNAAGEGHVHVHGDLKHADELLVTKEPAGGAAVPTNPPVIVARIS